MASDVLADRAGGDVTCGGARLRFVLFTESGAEFGDVDNDPDDDEDDPEEYARLPPEDGGFRRSSSVTRNSMDRLVGCGQAMRVLAQSSISMTSNPIH